MPKADSKKAAVKKPMVFLSGAAALAALILVAVLLLNPGTPAAPTDAEGKVQDDGNLRIQVKDITEQAAFYPVTVDGVKMEVLAVKAPDGTIRTAFNTCQVCYDSGRGYYVQEGNVLVCQNCGNRFRTSDVEKVKGGCNPLPIMPEDKTVDETTITIPVEVLRQAKEFFIDWKR